MRSKEVKDVEKYLQNERERRNELDRSRGQNKGREFRVKMGYITYR